MTISANYDYMVMTRDKSKGCGDGRFDAGKLIMSGLFGHHLQF